MEGNGGNGVLMHRLCLLFEVVEIQKLRGAAEETLAGYGTASMVLYTG